MSEETSKFKVQPCRKGLFRTLCGGVCLYFRLNGIRMKRVGAKAPRIQGPAVVLCNHGSFVDFAYAGTLLKKCYPHFVIARLYFYHKWLGRLLGWLGGFPKSMFAMDMESTKNCLRVLKDGGVLAMMPEARLSTAGRFEDIQEGTYSFLKKAGVPVYTLLLRGDYFADPKWGKGFRRGAVVESQLELLFDAPDMETLSVEDIKQAVEKRLWYDEFQWLESRPEIHYRSPRLAEGLENILAVCPLCGGRNTVTTHKLDVFCERCGKLTSLDDRYAFDPGFRFAHPGEWYDWQKSVVREEIAADPDYCLQAEVELRLPSADGKSLTRSSGRGVCTLNREGLTYKGTRDGGDWEISFPLKRVYRLLFGAGENFEIYNGSEILYFVPEERRSAVDWYLTSMILYDETVGNKTALICK